LPSNFPFPVYEKHTITSTGVQVGYFVDPTCEALPTVTLVIHIF